MNPRAPGKAGISYLLYSPQGQMWAHTASHGLPKPSFTSCHWIIFQANPSKKLWKLLLPPQHEMQSLCCPIQLVVTTSAPKNKLWKKEGREEPSELAYVSAFFGLEQEFYHQETPTLWQPRPQQPAKQSTVTQIEVSFKKRWRKKLWHIHMQRCCCPTIRCLHQLRPLSTPHERQSPELISHPELKLCVFSAGAESRHWAVFVQPQHPVTSSDKPSHCWQMEDKHLSQESSDKQTHQKHSECSLCLFMAVHCCFFPPKNQHFAPPIIQSPPCFLWAAI